MRKETKTIYEAEDYRKAEEMSDKEVIYYLDRIDDGWIGSSRFYGQHDFEGDEDDYDRYCLHTALRKAITKLALIKEKENETGH